MAENDPNTSEQAEQPVPAKKAPAKKAPAKKAAAEKSAPTGVRLTRGKEKITAYKPATVTRLKSQGWKVAE